MTTHSGELLELRGRSVPRGVSNNFPIVAARAENAVITDVDGRTFIDLTGGIGAMNVGHCHPRVVAAVKEQSERFSHTFFSVAMYDVYLQLAERLNEATPGDFPKKTMFVNSGAEAVENGVKIARHFTGRGGVIVFEGAFHGRTLLGMSMTSKVMPYKTRFGPFAPEVYRIPYAYCYRCPIGRRYPECGAACAELLTHAFRELVEPETVAAVVIEPVQGEGGFIPAPPEYLQQVKAICEEHGILFVCDEIQTGIARTGKMFAIEHSGVLPDVVLTAKSLAAGYPLAGVTGRAEVMDSPPPGSIGGTYSGNPVACAAGLAVFDIVEHDGLMARAEAIGMRVRNRFEGMQQRFPVVGDVRGKGAMMALELVRDRRSKEPAPDLCKELRRRMYENGVLILLAGAYDNVIRLLMPLTIEDEVLERALDVMEEGLARLALPAGG